jgi:amino acid adenylation domain-containing protein/thioester reductase-like protein
MQMFTRDHDLYAHLASALKEHADLTAIIDGSSEHTYADIAERAHTVAFQLKDCAVGPGELVPVFTHGGVDMVAAMIGCLQQGAAFAIIDAGGPVFRTAQMLDDISSRIAICDALAVFPAGRAEEIIRSGRTDHSDYEASVSRDAEDLAYGFFTSGSTGRPKCCLNTLVGLSNRFKFNSSIKRLSPGEKVLQNSKHTFDPMLWQTLWPLTKGASVVIPERRGLMDIENTIAIIDQHQVVMTDMVPSVLDVVIKFLKSRTDASRRLKSLEHVFVGGEELTAQLANDWRKLVPWAQLTNTYGPTEAAIGMIYYPIDKEQSDAIPIGYSIPGTNYEVVDEALLPVLDGEIGQIAISGKCLGRGYLNNAEKTNEVFKDVKTADGGTRRLYLTGDRGRRFEGKLYYHGRTDDLAKINGVRVELKEVETNVASIDCVRKCNAVTIKDKYNKTKIYAFCTLLTKVSNLEMRKILRETLPVEFIPSEIVIVDEFPVTDVGKVDKAKLRELAKTSEFVREARTLDEELLSLVRSYVASGEIDPDESLFDLGLDSLGAVMLSLDIEAKYGIRFSASAIFEAQTLNAIHQGLDTSQHSVSGNHTASVVKRKIAMLAGQSLVAATIKTKVLLTGATGYVGVHLLRELSKRDGTTVLAIVRARSNEDALERLKLAAVEQRIADGIQWQNVEAIVGDLRKPGIGIDQDRWEYINPALSEVFHVGADVNFYKSFRDLEHANVQSTICLAEQALANGRLHFHYISTVGVLAQEAEYDRGTAGEPRPTEITKLPEDGYSQSKLAGEIIAQVLSEKGIPVSIYRLGEVMPCPNDPVLNPRAAITALLETIVDLGCVFDAPINIHYTPIDYLVKSLAASSLRDAKHKEILNLITLSHPVHVNFSHVTEALVEAVSRLVYVSKEDFLSKVKQRILSGGTVDKNLVAHEYVRNLRPSGGPTYSAGSAENWPIVDIDYLKSVFREVPTLNTRRSI